MKKSGKVLHYFGLDCGMLEFFKYSSHKLYLQRNFFDTPAFYEHALAEKIAACAHTNRDPDKQEVGFIFL
jgi:hypothetical protein